MKDKIKFWGLFALVMLLGSPVMVAAQSGGKRTEASFKLFSGGNYHMKANMWATGMAQATVFETYIKDGKIASTTTTQGATTRIINKDKKTYMIMDSEKTVMVMPFQEQNQAGTETAGMVFVSSGTADFRGKTLPYEEYSDSKAAKETKVRYFFDGNKLAGIRNIMSGVTMDIEILALDQNIPANVFDIPAGYQVTDMSSFGAGFGAGFGR